MRQGATENFAGQFPLVAVGQQVKRVQQVLDLRGHCRNSLFCNPIPRQSPRQSTREAPSRSDDTKVAVGFNPRLGATATRSSRSDD